MTQEDDIPMGTEGPGIDQCDSEKLIRCMYRPSC